MAPTTLVWLLLLATSAGADSGRTCAEGDQTCQQETDVAAATALAAKIVAEVPCVLHCSKLQVIKLTGTY